MGALANRGKFRQPEWNLFCSSRGMAIGRYAAYCAYPAAAWRRLSKGGRVLLVTAYFGGSYLLTLMALLVI